MSVIPLTIFFSLLLAGLFALLFAREQSIRRFPDAGRDSLLPLADEQARLAGTDRPDQAADDPHPCGCHDGSRPPCPGCRKHRDHPAATTP